MCCHTATSERGCGWVGYLPSNYIARSEASEHAFARATIHRQDPLRNPALRRPFSSGCTTRASGALLIISQPSQNPFHFHSYSFQNNIASSVSRNSPPFVEILPHKIHYYAHVLTFCHAGVTLLFVLAVSGTDNSVITVKRGSFNESFYQSGKLDKRCAVRRRVYGGRLRVFL